MVLAGNHSDTAFQEHRHKNWRGSPVVNSTCFSFKKLWFTFQHPYGVSQIPLTTVPGNLTPYSPSMGIRYTHGGDAYIQTLMYTEILKINF